MKFQVTVRNDEMINSWDLKNKRKFKFEIVTPVKFVRKKKREWKEKKM